MCPLAYGLGAKFNETVSQYQTGYVRLVFLTKILSSTSAFTKKPLTISR